MTAHVYDKRACALGEGPLWHPLLKQLFWFDILGKKLLTQEAGKPRHWQFDEHVSAAGWVDAQTLLIASESGLYRFDIASGERNLVVALEADDPSTRSNDGRADPWGGFWIGTMGKNAEQDRGAIYRYYRGEVTQLYAPITISNSISFSPDRQAAYFCDTKSRQIMRQALSATNGYPKGNPEILIDLNQDGLNPDGSVVDADGCIWSAQWGAGRVARYSPKGKFMSAISFPAGQISCPAFGGAGLMTLFATSAAHGVSGALDGFTFETRVDISGQTEHRVNL